MENTKQPISLDPKNKEENNDDELVPTIEEHADEIPELESEDALSQSVPLEEESCSLTGSNGHGKNLRKRTEKQSGLSANKTNNSTSQKVKIPTNRSIISIYTDQKKDFEKFRPSTLQTIFEEPQIIDGEEKFFGKPKVKRQLKLNDGLNTTKSKIKKRKTRILKLIGHRQKVKKISKAKFSRWINETCIGNPKG